MSKTLYLVIPVFNEEEALPVTAPLFCGKIEEDLSLHGIGVLKLINEVVAVAVIDMAYQTAAGLYVTAQHITQIELVVEVGKLAVLTQLFRYSSGSRNKEIHSSRILILFQLT